MIRIVNIAAWILPLIFVSYDAQSQSFQGDELHDGTASAKPHALTEAGQPPMRPLVFVPKSYPGIPNYDARKSILGTRSAPPSNAPKLSSPPELYVLVPEEVALTVKAQPTLFWYVSHPTRQQILITINHPDHPQPILSLELEGASTAGIQRLDLARLGVTLTPQVAYEWVVTLVVNPDRPAENIYSRSEIWCYEPPRSFVEQLTGKSRFERAQILTTEGIWIDAFEELCNLIDHQPQDSLLRRTRNDLLEQVKYEVAFNPSDGDPLGEKITLARTGPDRPINR